MWSMPQEPVQHGVMLINPNTGIALNLNLPAAPQPPWSL